MSLSPFGKMFLLLSSKAKQAYAGEICQFVSQTLATSTNKATIKAGLSGAVPKGYILV